MERQAFLEVYRHSLSHVLAKAVIELYGKENVQYAIGPQIADGFYYDFLLPETITKEDEEKIDQKMREILKRKEPWTRKEVSKAEALELFKDQKFKTELIEELPEDEPISCYTTGDDFIDLCKGPHVENSQDLLNSAFQIKSVSGSYWRGDENREQLQRVYVYAFPDKKELKAHIALVQEAMERDHKKLGPQLDLFFFDATAPGMPYWLPRGWNVFNALVDFWRRLHYKNGYQEISAPVINAQQLWVTSGHWDHYQNNMFLVPLPGSGRNIYDVKEGDELYAIKPMNCPNAIKAYAARPRSYKELPLRLAETDIIHRKEKSGELNGLFRVQEFHQDDDHTFLMPEQIGEEIGRIMDLAAQIYDTFGLSYKAELSTRPEDFMGDIEDWNAAETALKQILDEKYGEGGYEINEGDGAFYGPKIDLSMQDALGREWQMGTIQLDFQLPLNFDLKYVAPDGSYRQPVLIHRALFGSLERFIGILIENFKGSFPFWLSPMQVGIVPIRPAHNDYAKKVEEALYDARIRVEANYADMNMKLKIKEYKHLRDPYIVVLGDREAEEGSVSINIRGSNKNLQNVPLETFLKMCEKMNKEYSLELLEEVPEDL